MEISWSGPSIDDVAILKRLPIEFSAFLEKQNGYIAVGGGFHLRGACRSPMWHSLRVSWEGEYALHNLYPELQESDIPLAEDCLGDQYLLRDGQVIRLAGETGEIEEMEYGWVQFLARVEADPIDYLNLGFMQRFLKESGPLAPGLLIHAYPPFVSAEGRNASLKAIPALELRVAHADFARQIRDQPDGQKIRISVS